ncbi:MAG: HAD family hydrolase [Acidobacteria bacterium]|nr:HAD family hydrolase [Acidobacteriota bacterium]
MRRDTRAVIFDLDDTLYPYRRFKLSGFLAVARHLSDRAGLDVRLGFTALAGASRGARRGAELEACLAQYDLPAAWLPELVEILRYHQPRLTLPPACRRTLQTLRGDGWRLGILTNGSHSIQAAKVAALGLAPLVDVVAYASTIGTGRGKPDPDTFAWIARELSVPASRSVFVGDDEQCDVSGAAAAGMLPVRCAVWTSLSAGTAARAVVDRLSQVPAIASSLIEEASNRHAA